MDPRSVRKLFLRRVRSDRMFSFVDRTWNPITGCLYRCSYCWAVQLARRFGLDFSPRFHSERLRQRFRPGELVFAGSFGDMFGPWVPDAWINAVFDVIRGFPDTVFLLLTKNPKRYLELELPDNVVAGATIETDLDEVEKRYSPWSPPPTRRLDVMRRLSHPLKMVSVEPALRYSSPESFATRLVAAQPLVVVVGPDNYNAVRRGDAPSTRGLEELARRLEEHGVPVIRKWVHVERRVNSVDRRKTSRSPRR